MMMEQNGKKLIQMMQNGKLVMKIQKTIYDIYYTLCILNFICFILLIINHLLFFINS